MQVRFERWDVEQDAGVVPALMLFDGPDSLGDPETQDVFPTALAAAEAAYRLANGPPSGGGSWLDLAHAALSSRPSGLLPRGTAVRLLSSRDLAGDEILWLSAHSRGSLAPTGDWALGSQAGVRSHDGPSTFPRPLDTADAPLSGEATSDWPMLDLAGVVSGSKKR
jgi:hypothetical protein